MIGASAKPTVDYCIITNLDENGYDFYIAYEIAEQTRNDLFDPVVMGFDSRALNFEILTIQKSSYAYYRTKKTINPLNEAFEIRKSAALNNALIIRDAPEIMAIHWRDSINRGLADKRYIEIFLPI